MFFELVVMAVVGLHESSKVRRVSWWDGRDVTVVVAAAAAVDVDDKNVSIMCVECQKVIIWNRE